MPGTRPFIDARGEDENRAEKVTVFYRVSGGESGRFYRVPRGQSDLCHGVPPISTSVPSLVWIKMKCFGPVSWRYYSYQD